jgi:hypothetical protein
VLEARRIDFTAAGKEATSPSAQARFGRRYDQAPLYRMIRQEGTAEDRDVAIRSFRLRVGIAAEFGLSAR